MWIDDLDSGKTHDIEIIPVVLDDYSNISNSRFWFSWIDEENFDVYKLRIRERSEILGLISLENHPAESRIEIRLLAVSKENRGKKKKYDRIAGNLIAFASKKALMLFGEWACVSLLPKTQLIEHYVQKYGMTKAGRSLFVEGIRLIELIRRYDHG